MNTTYWIKRELKRAKEKKQYLLRRCEDYIAEVHSLESAGEKKIELLEMYVDDFEISHL